MSESLLPPRTSRVRNGLVFQAAAPRGRGSGPFERETVLILEEDPDLGVGLTEEDRSTATRLLRAPVLRVNSPEWRPPECDPSRTFGLLVLSGLLGRRVRIGSAINTELLGCGDILRPWDEPILWNLTVAEANWRVFDPVAVAVLDERITTIIGRRSELLVAFSSRLLRRARYAAQLAAIGHLTRVEDRLLFTLWHMASSWGVVTVQGVCVPFSLTHQVLGEIIGARRPSVTVALSRLQQNGTVIRRNDGRYVLTGQPPANESMTPEAA